jgi:hypothetical protein
MLERLANWDGRVSASTCAEPPPGPAPGMVRRSLRGLVNWDSITAQTATAISKLTSFAFQS